MFSNLWFTINALLPIVILILLGYLLKRMNFFGQGFLKTANKIVFRVFLPISLFYSVYKISGLDNINWKAILFVECAIAFVFILGFFIVKIFISESKQKSVIHQAIFRSNYAIIGLPLVEMLSGSNQTPAYALAALLAGFSIPLFNIFGVIALSMYEKTSDNKTDYKKMFLNIIKNPLIIAVFLGIFVIAIRVWFISIGVEFTIESNIPFLYKSIQMGAGVAAPFALFVLGAGFTFNAVKKLKKQIIIGVFSRIVIVPAVCLIAAYIIGFREVEFPSLIALFATPIAVSSVSMAQEMGQDDELAGQLVFWTSILSAFTLFIIILVVKSIGIL